MKDRETHCVGQYELKFEPRQLDIPITIVSVVDTKFRTPEDNRKLITKQTKEPLVGGVDI